MYIYALTKTEIESDKNKIFQSLANGRPVSKENSLMAMKLGAESCDYTLGKNPTKITN